MFPHWLTTATKTQKIPISLTATRIEGGCRTELRGSPRFF